MESNNSSLLKTFTMEQKPYQLTSKTVYEVLTRTGYCPKCAREYRPRTGNTFVAFGATNKRAHYKTGLRVGMYGFTPHIYSGQILGENVIVHISCAMTDCSMKLRYDMYKQKNVHVSNHWVKEVWTIKQWNDLRKYKKDMDYHI